MKEEFSKLQLESQKKGLGYKRLPPQKLSKKRGQLLSKIESILKITSLEEEVAQEIKDLHEGVKNYL